MAVCRALFDGATVDVEAGPAAVEPCDRLLRPCRNGGVVRRTQPVVARARGGHADGVLIEFLHKPSLDLYVGHVRAGAAHVGRPMPRWYYSTCIVTDRSRLDHIRPHMTYRLVDSPEQVKQRLGITPDDVAEIREAMSDGINAAAHLIPGIEINRSCCSGRRPSAPPTPRVPRSPRLRWLRAAARGRRSGRRGDQIRRRGARPDVEVMLERTVAVRFCTTSQSTGRRFTPQSFQRVTA